MTPQLVAELDALLAQPDPFDVWRKHEITQPGIEGRLETIWPALVKKYTAIQLSDREQRHEI
jgi:hypothetical protein